jgi:hypothetical protein
LFVREVRAVVFRCPSILSAARSRNPPIHARGDGMKANGSSPSVETVKVLKKIGRPKKQLNWKSFESLCRIQCTIT